MVTTIGTVCTCSQYNAEDSDLHDFTCDLWENEAFCYGSLYWDPDTQTLVDIEDVIADLSDQISEQQDATPFYTQLEKVYDSDDILTVVLNNLHPGKDLDEIVEGGKTFYAVAAEWVGPSVVAAFENISNRHSLDADELATIDAFGRECQPNLPAGVSPYFCSCELETSGYQVGKVLACDGCGVLRWNTKDGPWVPNYERRQREIKLALTGSVYSCTCPNKKWACMACDVGRSKEELPWSYWSKQGQGTWIFEGDLDKSSPFDTTTVGNVASLWGGTGVTTYQKCRHYGEVVDLPDGTKIMCSSEHKRKSDEDRPDFGCYFYSGWRPEWLYLDLDWQDYGLPNIPHGQVMDAVEICLDLARAGRIVEIGCMGGHGRTGTFLALLALHAGAESAEEAIDFVHTKYCKEAIEGKKQEWYINRVFCELNGLPIPPMPPKPCEFKEHMAMNDDGEECDPKCEYYDRDYRTWLDRLEKALTLPADAWTAKPVVTKTVTGSVSSGGYKPFTITDSKGSTVYVNWTVPVPPKQANGYCQTSRHQILHWRREQCDCTYWKFDEKRFIKDGQPQASTPKPEWLVERERKEAEATMDDLIINGQSCMETRSWTRATLAKWLTDQSEADLNEYARWLTDLSNKISVATGS